MDIAERDSELLRLKYLDRQHRRISEEAEATVREIRTQLYHLSKEAQQVNDQLRYDYANGASEIAIAADWAHCDALLLKFSRL